MTEMKHEIAKNDKILVNCTWDNNSDCESCSLKGQLKCKWKKEHLMYFLKLAFYVMIPSGVGFLLAGLLLNNWIYLIVYVLFWGLFFGVFEIRVLCSHCPYYLEEKQGLVLHCLANHGSPKLWKYHPEPMRLWEKLSFLAGALFFVLFPLVPQIDLLFTFQTDISLFYYSILAGMTFLLGLHFFYKLRKNVCSRCVNFSCPLNTVEKPIVDAYLQKNPIMREAWEKSGYKLG